MFSGWFSQQSKAQNFIAEQYFQKASIVLNGKINEVFRLFTVLGEKKWATEWNPELIFPLSGNMQEGLIFKTSDHIKGAPPLIWVVSKYNTIRHELQYTIASPVHVAIITVSCTTINEHNTKAEISYKLTGLNRDGDELSHHLIAKVFVNNLKDWEKAINSYLEKSK